MVPRFLREDAAVRQREALIYIHRNPSTFPPFFAVRKSRLSQDKIASGWEFTGVIVRPHEAKL